MVNPMRHPPSRFRAKVIFPGDRVNKQHLFHLVKG
jgi:hypothetical protein